MAVAFSQDELPLYRRVARDIERKILAGELATGARMPSVRDLAKKNGISRLTALKAYHDLQERGLLDSTVGRGTFVSAPSSRSVRVGGRRPLTPCGLYTNLEKDYAAARVISFATGGADPRLFHLDEMLADIRDCDESGDFHAQHCPPDGDPQLISEIGSDLRQRGFDVQESEVLVTGGDVATKALFLHVFCGKGDRILVENPAFPWAEGFYRAFGVEATGIQDTDQGWNLDNTEAELAKGGVKALFVSAVSHTTGRVQSAGVRSRMLELADRYDCLILEDLSLLRFDFRGVGSASLLSVDRSERVIGYECCSKMVAPAVSAGWLVAPQIVKRALCLAGLRLGSRPPQMLQVGLREMMRRGRFTSHVNKVRSRYKQRRDTMIAALSKTMPEGVCWQVPPAGFSLWLQMPPRVDAGWVTESALERGVSVVSGDLCCVPQRQSNALRLSFSNAISNDVEDGVLVLSQVIRRAIDLTH